MQILGMAAIVSVPSRVEPQQEEEADNFILAQCRKHIGGLHSRYPGGYKEEVIEASWGMPIDGPKPPRVFWRAYLSVGNNVAAATVHREDNKDILYHYLAQFRCGKIVKECFAQQYPDRIVINTLRQG